MPLPLGPILAQLITLSVGDRTEARYVASGDLKRFEGSTVPSVGLALGTRRLRIYSSFSAAITLAPLETTPRYTTTFYTGALGVERSWRRDRVYVGTGFAFGEIDFGTQALTGNRFRPDSTPPADTTSGNKDPSTSTPQDKPPDMGTMGAMPPTTPGTTPGGVTTPNSDLVRASGGVARYGVVTVGIGYGRNETPTTSWSLDGGYSISGALDKESEERYPLVKSFRVGATLNLTMGRNDGLGSMLFLQQATASNGTSSQLVSLTETWVHRLSPQTFTTLLGGLVGTRSPEENDIITKYTIFPTVAVGIGTRRRLGRGVFSCNANAGSAPVLDLVTAAVDPRLSFGLGAGYGQGRFSASLAVGSAISIAGSNSAGALQSVTSGVGVGYQALDNLSVTAGGRQSWQTFQGSTAIPFSYAAFLGVTIGAGHTFGGRR